MDLGYIFIGTKHMIVDTGLRVPNFNYLGYFPFEITPISSGSLESTFNASGFSGPVESFDDTPEQSGRSFSGILGAGTFYPAPFDIDQLTRMFWGVKSWRIDAEISRTTQADYVDCIDFFGIEITAHTSCSIGSDGFGRSYRESFSRFLPLQDLASFTSTGYGYDNTGAFPVENHKWPKVNCIPDNPIQNFSDLFSRKEYFHWSPTEPEISGFKELAQNVKDTSPYFNEFPLVRAMPSEYHGYDCAGFNSMNGTVGRATSYISLSIMSPSIVSKSGSCFQFLSGETINTSGNHPLSYYGDSGAALTNKWGEITGYGPNSKPSGVYIPKIIDIGTGIGPFCTTGTPTGDAVSGKRYYPFIYFEMLLMNKNTAGGLCYVKDYITSLKTSNHTQSAGYLNIYDHAATGDYSSVGEHNAIQIPLYFTNTPRPNGWFFRADLHPSTFWVDESGNADY